MTKRITWDCESVKKFVANRGYSYLSDVYINQNTKEWFMCPLGHKFYTIFKNFKDNGTGCSVCNKERLKYRNFKGRSIDSDGYIEIYIDYNHPFKRKHKKNLFEHRIIVENYLKEHFPNSEFLIEVDGFSGKWLNPKCHVHHKNEIKDDNNINNLKPMWKTDHHKLHGKERYDSNTTKLYKLRKDITKDKITYYTNEGKSIKEISILFQCSEATIYNTIKGKRKV